VEPAAVSYEGKLLRYHDSFMRGYTMVYVLSDAPDELTKARKITVLTLDDVGVRMPSDQTWWWFYDEDHGLEGDKWEVVL
jgi:hypothetical protein